MPQGVDFGALGGAQGVKKKFSNMVMWHIDGDDKQNRMQVTFSS